MSDVILVMCRLVGAAVLLLGAVCALGCVIGAVWHWLIDQMAERYYAKRREAKAAEVRDLPYTATGKGIFGCREVRYMVTLQGPVSDEEAVALERSLARWFMKDDALLGVRRPLRTPAEAAN